MTDGKVDRKKLGNIVFNDKSKLERLNELVHPAVIDRCVSLSTLLSVLDAPQLLSQVRRINVLKRLPFWLTKKQE